MDPPPTPQKILILPPAPPSLTRTLKQRHFQAAHVNQSRPFYIIILDSGFAQIFWEIKKLSNLSFVAFRHVKRVNASLQLDGVAQIASV